MSNQTEKEYVAEVTPDGRIFINDREISQDTLARNQLMGRNIKLTKFKDCTPTPHNEAKFGEIAERVLMAGDPQRAHLFAQKFLTNPRRVSYVRGICVWTGTYKDVPVTIMGHGMGIPSICIYAYELYKFYKVKTIYRFGSCGVMNTANLNLGDIVLASSGWSDIPTEEWLKIKEDQPHIFLPTQSSNTIIRQTAAELNFKISEQPVIASNFFYNELTPKEEYEKTGASVIEMEAYGLFAMARKFNTHAACLLTVSDNIETHEEMSAAERQTTFDNMFKLALESIIKEK